MLRTIRRKVLMSLCVWILASPYVFGAESATALETQNEKESYSIGYQVGRSMTTDGVDVDMDKFRQGLQDAVNNKQPLLTDEEMRTLIVDYKKRAREIQLRKVQEQIAANAKESEKFLEENKTKEGVKTTKSGLQYRVLKEGEGASPSPEDFVTVNYRGTFIDGQEFDSTYAKGKPARIQVDGVIKGWTEALPLMKTGSKWQLFVPPDLAYGRRGLGQRIPPNKVLVFEIELIGTEKGDKAQQPSQTKIAQRWTVRKMDLTGEIVKVRQGYIIQAKKGDVPTEIYTILNPDEKVLDGFAKSGATVPIEVRIVSGDNVDIEKINGKAYR